MKKNLLTLFALLLSVSSVFAESEESDPNPLLPVGATIGGVVATGVSYVKHESHHEKAILNLEKAKNLLSAQNAGHLQDLIHANQLKEAAEYLEHVGYRVGIANSQFEVKPLYKESFRREAGLRGEKAIGIAKESLKHLKLSSRNLAGTLLSAAATGAALSTVDRYDIKKRYLELKENEQIAKTQSGAK